MCYFYVLQLTLYSVMVGDRYETPPPGGLLYYLKGGHMQGLPALPHEKRGVALFNFTTSDVIDFYLQVC